MLYHILGLAELLLLSSVAAIYIIQCPFNKVEESFNTQAVHDIVNIFPRRIPIFQNQQSKFSNPIYNDSFEEPAFRSQMPWDHTQFPGVVPRTFVGALVIGIPLTLARTAITQIFTKKDNQGQEESDFTAQFVLQLGARFALSSLVVVSLSILSKSIQRRYGIKYRIFFVIISVSQFHYLFYAGRFIPNTYAAVLANLFFASWIGRRYSQAIVYVAVCVVIFRFDTAAFFGLILLDAVFIKRVLPLTKLLQVGIPIGVIAITTSFIIDSIFWGRPIWPEFAGFYFNVWLNKSHEWGIQPYFWYIDSCIPRIMLFTLPLMCLAEHKFTREYFIPVIAFIFTYSILPHKELRFILFVTPLLNLCAASGLANIQYVIDSIIEWIPNIKRKAHRSSKDPKTLDKNSNVKNKSAKRNYFSFALFLTLALIMLTANLICSFIMCRVSSYNYPGGQAALSLGVNKELLDRALELKRENPLSLSPRSKLAVYVNNLSAQTGFSRFVQVDGVYYSKSPKLDSTTFKSSYELIYLVLEPKEVKIVQRSFCLVDEQPKNQTDIGECTFPNQSKMFCTQLDTVNAVEAVNIEEIVRKVKRIQFMDLVYDILEDKNVIITRTALKIIRCSRMT